MTIRLLDKTTEGRHSTLDRNQVERWFGGQCVSPEATEDLVIFVRDETRFKQEEWTSNYYEPTMVSTDLIRVIGNDVLSGNIPLGRNVEFATTAGFGGGVVVTSGAAVGCNAVLDNNAVLRRLTISGHLPAADFCIWPVAREPRNLTQDSEQLQQYKCRQVLFAFTSHVKKILERKEIAITETRIRNWQAIDDTNWKQCILDLTVNAESHIALSIWDDLTEELQKFIGLQPEVDRPFLETNLSLDIKWV